MKSSKKKGNSPSDLVHQTTKPPKLSSSPRKKVPAKKGPPVEKQGVEKQVGKKPVVLLSGGNPQIAKGDGDAPVQEYLSALQGWKREMGRRLDSLIVRTVPNVCKAVRWNSPFYGIEGQGWFLAIHVLTRYVKVTFFRGTFLTPIPPGGTPKSGDSRWLDIYEGDEFEEQLTEWVKQAAVIPGWNFNSKS